MRDRVKRLRPQRPLVSSADDIALVRKTMRRRFPSLRQFFHSGRILSVGEKRIVRLSIVTLAIGLVWAGVDVVRAYRVQVAAVGGTYTEAVVGAPDMVNPLFASLSDVDTDIAHLVFSGLMRYDEKQRLVPDMAVGVTVSEDKKTYTFELRRDVLWHDGEPVTADDVIFTFDTIQDQQVGSPLLVTFQGVEVKAIDDYHVQFTLKEAFSPFLSTLTVGIIPKHIWASIPTSQMRLHKDNLQPIGTGPFAFDKLVKDNTGYIYQYLLKRFDRYYRQPPYIQSFVFQFYPTYGNTGGAVEAIREGHVDGISFVPHEQKDKVERKHVVIRNVQLPQYTALFFNEGRNPILQVDSMRTALAHAVDKDRLVHEALRDEGKVIQSPILPGFPGYDAGVTTTPYRIDEANRLLDKISTRIAADTYRTMRHDALLKQWQDQHPDISFATTTSVGSSTTTVDMVSSTEARAQAEADILVELDAELHAAQTFYRQGIVDKKSTVPGPFYTLTLVTADTAEYRQAAELISGFWQEVGVQTTVRFVAPKDISREVLKDRKYDVLLYGAIVGSDPDQYPFWHSSQVDFPGLNLSRYANRTADKLLEQARATTSDDERVTAYQKFQTILLADLPAIFLYSPSYRYATSDRVQGISVESIFQPADRFANVTQWYVKTTGRWQW